MDDHASPAEGQPTNHSENLLSFLEEQNFPLYAILDAARSPSVLMLLSASEDEHDSLFSNDLGKGLERVGPHLVRFEPTSSLLRKLVEQGWGRSWGVYLTSDRSFSEIQAHFRRFLVVDLDGRQVYFRFYDPRVLRIYLRTCSSSDLGGIFALVRAFYVEHDMPATLLRCEFDSTRLTEERFSINPESSINT